MKDLTVDILENKKVSSAFSLLKFKYPEKILPGQFFNIRIKDGLDPYLRRPISVHDLDSKTKTVSLLYKVVGHGTEVLSGKKKGSQLKVLGPLGNSFDAKGLTSKSKIAIVGGGVGIAPFLYLVKELKKKGIKIYAFLGFRNKKEIYIDPELKKACQEVFIATDDGSAGHCGAVTSCFAEELNKIDLKRVFVCGPDPMLKIMHAICRKAEVPAEYSLESIMGCGIGACLCCVCDTIKGYKKVCSDGPIFKDEELKW
ncbi:dihydroorotate dehydrogenase electron transfer subunit [Candidatus Margulisiibacteriota bacterium]